MFNVGVRRSRLPARMPCILQLGADDRSGPIMHFRPGHTSTYLTCLQQASSTPETPLANITSFHGTR